MDVIIVVLKYTYIKNIDKVYIDNIDNQNGRDYSGVAGGVFHSAHPGPSEGEINTIQGKLSNSLKNIN